MGDRITEWFRKAKRKGQGYSFAPPDIKLPEKADPHEPLMFISDKRWATLDHLTTDEQKAAFKRGERVNVKLSQEQTKKCIDSIPKELWQNENIDLILQGVLGGTNFIRSQPLKRWEDLTEQERKEMYSWWPRKP